MKIALLGVDPALIETYTAVSEEVARAMQAAHELGHVLGALDTSVTIPGIVYVVDCGFVKVPSLSNCVLY